jgi:hypothetical protein
MIKYNIVVCCYGKMLVNMATYVIPVYSTPHTHTHTHLTRNYICSHIYEHFTITTQYHKMERYQRVHYFGILKKTGRQEDREIAGEDQ